ncbi:MAG: FAD-dependent oxidoreductase [Nitrospira sp.]
MDVVIVGAGPAGIAASLAAKEAGSRFVTIE